MRVFCKQNARRTLALVLALTMLAGMLGLSVQAVEPTPSAQSDSDQLRLWYDEPSTQTGTPGGVSTTGKTNAEDNIWQQDTLPIGSGDLGANIYGEIATERITLNEKTLWTKGPTEQDPAYNGGNIVANGRNGEAMKELEAYFKENPDGVLNDYDSSKLNSFLGQTQGYGYFAPWGELNIAYDSLSTVTQVYAALPGAANLGYYIE